MSYKISSGRLPTQQGAVKPAGQKAAGLNLSLTDKARIEITRNTPQQNSKLFTQSTLIHTQTGHIAVDRSTRLHQLEDDEEQEQSEYDEENAYQNSSSGPPKQAQLSRSHSSNRRDTSSSGATTSGVSSSKDYDDEDGDGRKRKHRNASTILGIPRNVSVKITNHRDEICNLIPSNVESKNIR